MNKTYTKRDSATAVLRKMGIDKAEYKNYIKVLADGTFTIVAKDVKKAVPVLVTFEKKPKAARAATVPRAKGVATVSSTARELILAGKDNKSVFAALQAKFNLDDSKKHYPTWYRAELIRKGVTVPVQKL